MTPRRLTTLARCAALLGALGLLVPACAPRRPPVVVTVEEPPTAVPAETPPAESAPTPVPTPPGEAPSEEIAPLTTTTDIAVSVWSEPKHLPPGGGQAQIIVRVQKAGNRPVPGLEVRLKTSQGSLYSRGRLLVTDARGMTRDRLATTRTATVKINVAGSRQELVVPVGEAPPGD
jgi:hypothetical protein